MVEARLTAFRQSPPTITADGDWRDRAACRNHIDHDPELWFPVGDGDAARAQAEIAKAICRTQCPVVEACLAYALAQPPRSVHGVWGGLSEHDRTALRRRDARRRERANARTRKDTP